jgi:uncharacterized protein
MPGDRRSDLEFGSGVGTMSGTPEQPVVFRCHETQLVGIVAAPAQGLQRGVVVIVGGPQYRVGSHRQFTLLCRHMATQGIASIRFDYHGSGDSEGPPALGVGGVSDDIRAAIDALLQAAPHVKEVVLWGLCGAASAAAMYAPEDPRVCGLVMLNPWVRTEQGHAKAQLRHYYLSKLSDRIFWQRILRFDLNFAASLRSFAASVVKASGRKPDPAQTAMPASSAATAAAHSNASDSLPDQVLAGLKRANLPVLVILSGSADLTANEFRQTVSSSPEWRKWLAKPSVQYVDVEGADHTFARAMWRDQVAALTTGWIQSLDA